MTKIKVCITDEDGVVLDLLDVFEDGAKVEQYYAGLKPEERLARRVARVLEEKFVTDLEAAEELAAEEA